VRSRRIIAAVHAGAASPEERPPPSPQSNVLSSQADESLWCWGRGGEGQLGFGGSSTRRITPVQVGTTSTGTQWYDWIAVAPAFDFTCGLRRDGSAWCWGEGFWGVTGTGSIDQHEVPAPVAGYSSWQAISGGGMAYTGANEPPHACGIRDGGSAWCWGFAGSGQLGNVDAGYTVIPMAVLPE
jgi:alpha-tubulin suppressor-like RCC1 family protein